VNPFLRTQPAIFDAPPVAGQTPAAAAPTPAPTAVPEAPDWTLGDADEPPTPPRAN
jgi:hypothetical protein